MSEEIIEESEDSTSVVKERKPRTEKVAEENPEIENASIQEATVVNDDGQKVIAEPKRPRAPRKSNVHTKEDGAIGSHAADKAIANAPSAVAKKPKNSVDSEKVAIWSSKNIRWTGVGELVKGYNIVKKEAAEKWLEREGIREATPEEVATHYGK